MCQTRALLQLSKLGRLRSLETRIHTGDGRGIARHPEGLSDLQELRLTATQITDLGLEHIAALRSLSVLHLDCTHVSNVGLTELVALRKIYKTSGWAIHKLRAQGLRGSRRASS